MVKTLPITRDTVPEVECCMGGVMGTSRTDKIRQWLLWVWISGFLGINICLSLASCRITSLFWAGPRPHFFWLPFLLWFCGCTVMSVSKESVSFTFLATIRQFYVLFSTQKILNHSFHLLDIEVSKMKNRQSRCPQMAHSVTVQTSKRIITPLDTCNIGGAAKAKKEVALNWFAVRRGGWRFLSRISPARPNRIPASSCYFHCKL